MKEIHNIGNKYVIDGILISIVLFSELCFAGTALFITPIAFFTRILFFPKIKVDNSIFWLMIMMAYTTLIGIVVPNNTDNFSVPYNFVVFLNLILICIIISRYP